MPMPDGKPDGGFLEIGDCAPGEDTYPWERNVELLLGSDGCVHALVAENSEALPTLDEEGRAVEDDAAARPEQLLLINASHFYCGVILQVDRAVRVAPIVRYLLHWPRVRIEQYCCTRSWHYEVLDLPELSQ